MKEQQQTTVNTENSSENSNEISTKKFRLYAKKLFLTYPDTKATKQLDLSQIIEELRTIFSRKKANIRRIVVGRETGLNDLDNPYEHMQMAIELDRRIDIRHERDLDLLGSHGKYEACRNFQNAVRYCQKDGNFKQWSDTKPVTQLIDATGSVTGITQHLMQIKDPIDRKTAIKGFSEASRAIYQLNKSRIDKAVFNTTINLNNGPKHEECEFNLPPEYVDWKLHHKHKKSLLLLGVTGTGKTSLALAAFKNPLMVRDLNALANLENEHDGIVFDDVIFDSLKRQNQIHLLDVERSSDWNIKFGIAKIPAGISRIFTSNQDVQGFIGEMKVPKEIERRYIRCWVKDNLFKEDDKSS